MLDRGPMPPSPGTRGPDRARPGQLAGLNRRSPGLQAEAAPGPDSTPYPSLGPRISSWTALGEAPSLGNTIATDRSTYRARQCITRKDKDA